MKQQILVIHGGNAFETYDEYMSYLMDEKNVSLDKMRRNGWKDHLPEFLGDEYDVLLPAMPNSFNARYLEWKIWLEKILEVVDDDIILIGHSLGAITLAKYLSENNCPKKIKATFLVAAPYNSEMHHPLVDFNIETDLTKLQEQGGKIFFYHSKDDAVVPFSNFERYKKELPDIASRIFEDRGHFLQSEFPEIVEDIKSLI